MRTHLAKRISRQRGIALITVVLSLAVLTALTADFSYTTQVDLASAANARDELRAEYAAMGVVNLSRLVIQVQVVVINQFKSMIGDFQLSSMTGPLLSLFAGKKEEMEGMGALIGIGTGGIKGVGLGQDVDVDLNMTSDDGRINVNCASGLVNVANQAQQKQLAQTLYALVYSPQYNRLFESPDADGQFTTREEIVRAIVDWSDLDDFAFDLGTAIPALGSTGGNVEDYHYDSRRDRYRAHNNAYDTIDELYQVKGVTDEFMALFGNALTVYGGCKVNLAAMGDLPFMAKVAAVHALIAVAAKNPNDPGLAEPNATLLSVHAAQELELRGSSFAPMSNSQELVNMIKDPMNQMAHLTLQSGNPPPSLLGIELDPAALGKMLTTNERRIYRVEARADVGRVKRKITAIWDATKQKSFTVNPNKPGDAKGSWVYFREE